LNGAGYLIQGRILDSDSADGETGIDEMRPAFHPAGACGVKKVYGKLFHVTRRAIHREVNGKIFSRKIFIHRIHAIHHCGAGVKK